MAQWGMKCNYITTCDMINSLFVWVIKTCQQCTWWAFAPMITSDLQIHPTQTHSSTLSIGWIRGLVSVLGISWLWRISLTCAHALQDEHCCFTEIRHFSVFDLITNQPQFKRMRDLNTLSLLFSMIYPISTVRGVQTRILLIYINRVCAKLPPPSPQLAITIPVCYDRFFRWNITPSFWYALHPSHNPSALWNQNWFLPFKIKTLKEKIQNIYSK